MKVSLKWLKEYVDINIDAKKYADEMTMSGTKVEQIEFLGHDIENVVIGKIEKIEKHPDADKLSITQINIGKDELIQIVTGANNISVGDIVPVALVGACLPNGINIKKGKLRGVDSFGMLCSHEELGIDKKLVNEKSKDGIYILDENYELGKSAIDVLGIKDEIIEFEITANRPDCRSIIGIAKETADTLKTKFKFPNIEFNKYIDGDISINLDVQDENLCERFILREVRNIKIQESPNWMKERLLSFGIRPINNIVDITNYVMAELGQPLHAYDKDKFDGNSLIVRRAQNNEKIKTLDDKDHILDDSILVISDEKNAIGIAGVMGGYSTQIDENTKNIYLEVANFNADNVRLTSRRLGVRTDSSSYFEKGIDKKRAEYAMQRACYLISELGAGDIVEKKIEFYPKVFVNKKIEATFEFINNIIGEELPRTEIINILNRVFDDVEINDDKIIVTVPSYRTDIEIKEDLIEEITRLYGYNNIKSKPLNIISQKESKSIDRIFSDKLKLSARQNGLTEISTYSFISPSSIEKVNISEEKYNDLLKLLNPLGEETSVMRTTLVPAMLEIISNNIANKNEEFFGFEYGNTFFKDKTSLLPKEIDSFVAGVYGNGEDFFTMKARLDGILYSLGVIDSKYIKQKENKTYHTGRCADVYVGEKMIATIGEVHPIVCENFKIKKRVYIFQLYIENLKEVSNSKIIYKPIPKYPAIEKDIALVVKKEKTVGEIFDIIKKYGKKQLESVALFDIYEGVQVGLGKKSLAFKLIFRANDRTLTAEEINKLLEKILLQLEVEADAVLR